jgi:hypothetical protein
MRAARLFVVALLGLGAAACGSSQSQRPGQTIMPNVTGQRLDLAENNLQHAGIDPAKITIVGGGTFGVVDKSNWQVCTQAPAPGGVVSSAPRLKVERTCEAVQQTTVPTTSPTPSQPSTPTTVSNKVDASAMEKAYLAHLANNGVQSIKAMCDAEYTEWSCFYEGVSDGPGFLRVNLQTDGGWPAGGLDTMANQAGRAWFNFIGCQFPNLTMIVVTINGLDHNIPRSETNADAMC